MRDTHVCPKCQHDHILRIRSIPDQGESPPALDLHIAKAIVGEGWFGPKIGAAGKLTAMVCKRCGYTELYTLNPEQIPVDGQWVSELVGPPSGGPFR